jgi:hypothetical protein
MTELWPHLPEVVAARLHQDLGSGTRPEPAVDHDDRIWAPVGARVHQKQIRVLIDAMTKLAEHHGFPAPAGPDARIAFDRAAAPLIREHMDLAWAEAGNRELWSFVSLVVLPHVTMWRFGVTNRERWVASDLTRHTWARLWWQAVVFAGRDDVLAALSESDLNQLLERRSIGGDPRLVAAMATAVIGAPSDLRRRQVIRDVTARIRRYLAFVDIRALDDAQVDELCRDLCVESFERIRAAMPR